MSIGAGTARQLSTDPAPVHRFGSRAPHGPLRVHSSVMESSADAVLTTRQLTGRGWSRGQLQKAVHSGELGRIRRGAYRSGTAGVTAESAYRHAVIAAATLNPTCTVSHLSAAALFGLPLVEADLSIVHLTLPRPTGGRRTPTLHRHPAHGTDTPVALDGLRVSSAARTLADVARTESVHTSIPMIDEALRRGLATTADLQEQRVTTRRLGGAARLRRTLELIDQTAESPGESLCRLLFGELGLPTPVPQAEIHDDRGRWIARVDLLLLDWAVVVEFDGMVKYGGLATDPDGTTALIREKQREDRIRETGLVVVRLVWADLYRPDRLAARVRHAMAQGRRALDAGLVTAAVRHRRLPGGELRFGADAHIRH